LGHAQSRIGSPARRSLAENRFGKLVRRHFCASSRGPLRRLEQGSLHQVSRHGLKMFRVDHLRVQTSDHSKPRQGVRHTKTNLRSLESQPGERLPLSNACSASAPGSACDYKLGELRRTARGSTHVYTGASTVEHMLLPAFTRPRPSGDDKTHSDGWRARNEIGGRKPRCLENVRLRLGELPRITPFRA